MTLPDRDAVSRREFVRAAVAVGGTAGLSACLDVSGGGEAERLDAPTGGDLASRSARQHAWNDVLERDADGNVDSPNHHVLLELSLTSEAEQSGGGPPTDGAREAVEATFHELERALAWRHDGLLFTAGYTPAYFDRYEASLPDSVDLPEPAPLTSLEIPETMSFDTHDVTVHLASDDPAIVLATEETLLGNRETLNGHEVETTLDGLLERVGRRTGFVGQGLPAEKQDELDGDGGFRGLPNHDIAEGAPFWMGYRSGFQETQASEDFVTIEGGPFAGGTTQHVESLLLQLQTWFDQDSHYQRVSKLFSHVHADEERVGEFGEKLTTGTNILPIADDTAEDASDPGVVGHAQKAARAREDGQPPLLRRDFNTTDADFPGVHFLSLQDAISTFVRVREAMAGEDLTDGAVGSRNNNGILQYLDVTSRGNYLVPPRALRALPRPDP